MSYVEVTTVEISPEAHHEYLTGAYANERLIIETLRRERDIITRKQMILDERIQQAERTARSHLLTMKSLEQDYGIGTQSTRSLAATLPRSFTRYGSSYQPW